MTHHQHKLGERTQDLSNQVIQVGERVYLDVEEASLAGCYILHRVNTVSGQIDSPDAQVVLCLPDNQPGDYITALASQIQRHVEHANGKSAEFTNATQSLAYGRQFQSAEFSAEAIQRFPYLAGYAGQRLAITALRMEFNPNYELHELLFRVTALTKQGDDPVDGDYFARALVRFSSVPAVTKAASAAGTGAVERSYFASEVRNGSAYRKAVSTGVIKAGEPFFMLEKNDELGLFQSDAEAICAALQDAANGDLYAKEQLSLAQFDPLVISLGQASTDKCRPATYRAWLDNAVQFPRLLSEIIATQDNLDLAVLAESMDVTIEDVNELFDRANAVWEQAKQKKPSGLSLGT